MCPEAIGDLRQQNGHQGGVALAPGHEAWTQKESVSVLEQPTSSEGLVHSHGAHVDLELKYPSRVKSGTRSTWTVGNRDEERDWESARTPEEREDGASYRHSTRRKGSHFGRRCGREWKWGERMTNNSGRAHHPKSRVVRRLFLALKAGPQILYVNNSSVFTQQPPDRTLESSKLHLAL